MKKLNRNKLCWCQSKKKYKHCHLTTDEALFELRQKGYPIPSRRIIRTAEQIEGIRRSCKLTAQILDELNTVIKPGMTTNDIDRWVHDYTLSHGATPAPLGYKGFPKSICTSLNEVICHGIPEDRVLVEGDILNVDVTCILEGYYGDSCRMYPIGTISKDAETLCRVTKECLLRAIEYIKPFDSLATIGETIEDHAHANGFSVVDTYGGHGLGLAFHEEPFVFHCRQAQKQMIMVPNMTFTIEPMINAGRKEAKLLADDWTAVTADGSLSAQWEHTVLITDDGADILT